MIWNKNLYINSGSLSNLKAVQDSLPHAVILAGARGVGTFAVASSMAKSTSDNILVIAKTGESIKISDIRNILSFTKTKVSRARVIIIDDADSMTKPAQNAFLKVLEEPVSNTHFILTSHSPRRLIPTIRSRCQVLYLNPIDSAQTKQLIDSLGVRDQAMRSQIEFIASGLPAEISRLATDEAYLESVSHDIKSVRTLLQGDTYSQVQLIQSLKDDRPKATELLEKSMLVIRRLLQSQPRPELVNKLDQIVTAHERIKLGANVRLQLLDAALPDGKI